MCDVYLWLPIPHHLSSFFLANRNSISFRYPFPGKGDLQPQLRGKPVLVWSEVDLKSLVPPWSYHFQATWARCYSICLGTIFSPTKCSFPHLPCLYGEIFKWDDIKAFCKLPSIYQFKRQDFENVSFCMCMLNCVSSFISRPTVTPAPLQPHSVATDKPRSSLPGPWAMPAYCWSFPTWGSSLHFD